MRQTEDLNRFFGFRVKVRLDWIWFWLKLYYRIYNYIISLCFPQVASVLSVATSRTRQSVAVVFSAVAGTMALSYKKDLGKYKDIDEDEILSKLSAEELRQLETALEEMDPEVRMRELEQLQEWKSGDLSKYI